MKKITKGVNDFATICPEGLKEWAYEKNAELGFYPDKIFANMSKPKLHWICPKGHEYQATANSYTQGHRCPKCARVRQVLEFNKEDLKDPIIFIKRQYEYAKKHIKRTPKVALSEIEGALDEWDYFENAKKCLFPDLISANSHEPAIWNCSKGHSYTMVISQHTRGCRCNICNGRVFLEGFSDLATKYPEILRYWDYEKNAELGLYPNKITGSSCDIAYWKCEKKHDSYPMRINNKVISKQGCPVCSNVQIQTGYNDFATICPESLNHWNFELNNNLGLNPHTLGAGIITKAYFNCPKGHEPYYKAIRKFSKGQRCPECKVSRGETKINEILNKYGIEYKAQYKDKNCIHIYVLPFDFAIMKNGKIVLLIEFDGKQHFEPVEHFGGKEHFDITQKRDKIKNEYCKKNNIPLLRIPYWEFDNIESILLENLSKYNLRKSM